MLYLQLQVTMSAGRERDSEERFVYPKLGCIPSFFNSRVPLTVQQQHKNNSVNRHFINARMNHASQRQGEQWREMKTDIWVTLLLTWHNTLDNIWPRLTQRLDDPVLRGGHPPTHLPRSPALVTHTLLKSLNQTNDVATQLLRTIPPYSKQPALPVWFKLITVTGKWPLTEINQIR